MFKLKLKNYRGFLDGTFDFSRINILIGENSAGKSSVFKFLLALKQSFYSPNNKESNITFSDSDTDLGNYNEVVYNHKNDKNISFSFEFKKDYFDYFSGYLAPIQFRRAKNSEEITQRMKQRREHILKSVDLKKFRSIKISFNLSSDLSEHSNIATKISNSEIGDLEFSYPQEVEYQEDQDLFLLKNLLFCNITFHSKKFNKTFYFENVFFEKDAFLTIVSAESLKLAVSKEFAEDSEDIDRLFYQIAFLLITQNYIRQKVFSTEYINPLISKPAERIYLEGDRKNTLRVGDIKELVDFLSSNNKNSDFKQNLTNILSEFGIANDFYVKKDGFTKELRVVLNDLDNNIKDVGFGVSLQLPILAQALISENTVAVDEDHSNDINRGEILLIEQPEVHLHPRLQAKFIDILLSIGKNNVYLIETHSEHIIRMLQILVKEKKYGLKAEDISIHYLKKDQNKISITSHKIDKNTGKLNPSFPKGFYDVSYDLAFRLID